MTAWRRARERWRRHPRDQVAYDVFLGLHLRVRWLQELRRAFPGWTGRTVLARVEAAMSWDPSEEEARLLYAVPVTLSEGWLAIHAGQVERTRVRLADVCSALSGLLEEHGRTVAAATYYVWVKKAKDRLEESLSPRGRAPLGGLLPRRRRPGAHR